MTENQTIGQRIRIAMHDKKLSMRALSRELNVAQPTIFKWCHDMSEPPISKLLKMACFLDVSVSWLISGDEGRSAQSQDTLGEALAGLKCENTADTLFFKVASDDMEPTIKAGDVAVVDRSVTVPDRSGIYLIDAGGESLIRRFSRALDGSLRVSCDNSERCIEIDTVRADDTINVLGRVTSKVSVERIR